ncbi:MAG: hypothetical protein A2233_04495 [Candidatus Kerfeldbacteria bacterium RIFOXYA2_FULL_38_24]|uniref:Uncharacterized protein n=1 Tax=Candidatus Kerfeldbacteria bacterium RIFOXYB2_FULL_38_14 TaxID=1798547 RepID=A0A1G2BAV9_9BACT|nr:MAG: hypothetical protein A2233_04495 [Candidatus Kerfeldbacteria bacterium RIFOXYA2_FULL_38_24]OGY86358.1 MAG: hypothetical protein A2319_03095 [Candidatus Kerfeldbacteria bacterium RIFOXYB2_FULL_38_14]
MSNLVCQKPKVISSYFKHNPELSFVLKLLVPLFILKLLLSLISPQLFFKEFYDLEFYHLSYLVIYGVYFVMIFPYVIFSVSKDKNTFFSTKKIIILLCSISGFDLMFDFVVLLIAIPTSSLLNSLAIFGTIAPVLSRLTLSIFSALVIQNTVNKFNKQQ